MEIEEKTQANPNKAQQSQSNECKNAVLSKPKRTQAYRRKLKKPSVKLR